MLRPQYHFRQVGAHIHIWNVSALVELAADVPVEEVSLDSIRELDECYWYDTPANSPTCRSFAVHMRQVDAADLSYPILLCAEGRILDGMHRVVKALLLGQDRVTARRLVRTPPPDYIDRDPASLPY